MSVTRHGKQAAPASAARHNLALSVRSEQRRAARSREAQRTLGGRVRALRDQFGWSQEQFAQICGLHRTYMGHVERGEKNVSLSTMVRISDALNVGLSDLFAAGQKRLRRAPQRNAVRDPHFSFVHIKHILRELRTERNALRQAVRDLMKLRQKLNSRVR